jgi:hypothetical protein
MVFEKSRWSCVVLVLVGVAGCSAPGKVTSSAPELTATSSQALTSTNGVWQNGLTTNGVWQNGVWQNGVWQNGVWQNGVWQNGVWQNGVWQNGVFQNGVWQNGVWQNGVWQNGVWQNGVWQNGVWQNGFANTALVTSQYTRQVLQYIYACAMPGTLSSDGVTGLYDTIIDPANPAHTCGDGGTCDAPYTCSSTGFCVIPCASDHTCDPGYTCTVLNTCVVPLKGAIGLGINADGTHWWDRGPSGDGGAGEAGVGDAGTSDVSPGEGGSSEAGQCDESCQRWVSACVLARTNAYGVHVNISMRAPANAPQAIKDALAVSDVERNGDDAGTAGYTLREGAYYGNIFATTPVNPPPGGGNASDGGDDGGDGGLDGGEGGSGPAIGPIASTPTFTACAGPGSNIPEITKRFCSSQGDQVVINVPGVCLATTTDSGAPLEQGTCAGEDQTADSGTFGAIQDCRTSASAAPAPCTDYRDPTCYNEVITVYLKEPISVCGNAVCEPPAEDSTNCPSDCHQGTWAKDFAPGIGFGGVDQNAGNPVFRPGMSAVGPDDSVVVAGNANTDIDLGGGTLSASQGLGVLAKYNPDGSYAWGVRLGPDPSQGHFEVRGVTVTSSGNIIVVGQANEGNAGQWIWISTANGVPGDGGLDAGGVTTLSLPVGLLSTMTTTRAVAVDSQGNIVIAGVYQGTATFGSTTFTSAATNNNDRTTDGYDVFVAKVSPQGTALWAQTLGGAGANYPSSLAIDSADNILVLTWERFTGGPTGGNVLRKLSSNGSVVLTNETGSNLNFEAMVVDPSNNVYAAGRFNNYSNAQPFGAGGPTINFLNGGPPFIVKYDGNGNFQWVNYATIACPLSVPTCVPGWAAGETIGFDPAGNVILGSSGYPGTGGSIDFGTGTFPSFPTYASTNIFLSAYSPDVGQLRWTKQIPTVLGSSLFDMTLDRHGRVVVSGNYSGSMQVDDHLLVTGVPEQPAVVDSFVSSFAAPSPLDTTPPAIGAGADQNGAPIFTVPRNIVAQATNLAGAIVFFMPPTAIDTGNAGTSVVCSPAPNTAFPIGTTTVTCTATDPLGNQSSATFTVTVVDTLGPLFSSPVADITVQATGASGATVTYTASTATDQVDGNRPVTCTPASGSVFAVGKTAVTCTASDNAASYNPTGYQSNNQSQATFMVTVTPSLAPADTCVGTQGSPAVVSTSPGVCGVTVSNATGVAGTCSGGAGGLASCTFDGASLEILGPGDHTVAVVGTAVSGATANCTSYLRVVDNEKPVTTCANQLVECTGNGGATVTPSATCTDNCSCTDSCGTAFFPVGTSQGSCTATDPSGNSSSCQASIRVVDSTPPVVTARPGPSQLQCHVDSWSDPGAAALDRCVGDLSTSVHASGIVDPLHVGSFNETYLAADPSGNVGSATRTVAVVDTLAPVITLNASPAVLQCGVNSYVEAGAQAVDVCAGDLTSKISETGAVHTGAVGTYALVYSVADPSGNAASATRSVNVIDTLPPTTSVTAGPNPAANKYININITSYSVTPQGGGTPVTGSADCWTSPGIAVAISAVDACALKQITYSLAGAQTGGATVAGGTATVAVSKTGSTTLSYYATDKAGNVAPTNPLPLFVGRAAEGFGFSCAPSPSLKNLPRHGTVTAKGTVTFTDPPTGKTYTKAFSFTFSY